MNLANSSKLKQILDPHLVVDNSGDEILLQGFRIVTQTPMWAGLPGVIAPTFFHRSVLYEWRCPGEGKIKSIRDSAAMILDSPLAGRSYL